MPYPIALSSPLRKVAVLTVKPSFRSCLQA